MCSYRKLLGLLAAVVLMVSSRPAFCFSSQDVPAADLPIAAPSPGATANSTPGEAESPTAPQSRPLENGSMPQGSHKLSTSNGNDQADSPDQNTDAANSQNNEGMTTSEPQANPEPSPPPPALDPGAAAVGPQLGEESLDTEINQASDPSMAASLRLTESARKRLDDGQIDDAMRELAAAVSLDGSNAFAYYFLGRAYFKRGNYSQALTFFRRAEIGFGRRSDWTGEALSYEGTCDELLGKPTDAAEAYKQALAAAPNNFRARVGYGRLASLGGPNDNLDMPAPNQDLAAPPPSAPDQSAPPQQPPTSAPD